MTGVAQLTPMLPTFPPAYTAAETNTAVAESSAAPARRASARESTRARAAAPEYRSELQRRRTLVQEAALAYLKGKFKSCRAAADSVGLDTDDDRKLVNNWVRRCNN